MPPAGNLARRIVDYDRDFAAAVLGLIGGELGAPDGERDPERLHSYLARVSADSEVARSTVEWKAGFARRERLRALGLELAELLRTGS